MVHPMRVGLVNLISLIVGETLVQSSSALKHVHGALGGKTLRDVFFLNRILCFFSVAE